MNFGVCLESGSCSGSPWFDSGAPWLGNGFYEIVDGDGDYLGEPVLLFNSGFFDVAWYTLPYGNGYYFDAGCTYGCNDPSSPAYHSASGCDPCYYYDCAGNTYYPAYGETCNGSSQDSFGVCCGGCYDSAACGSTGNECDYGSGSQQCGCNVTQDLCGNCGNEHGGCADANSPCNYDSCANYDDGSCQYDQGCGCGSEWYGSLPNASQVLSGVSFSKGQFSFTGTLQPGVPKSKVILSAALGIPIM